MEEKIFETRIRNLVDGNKITREIDIVFSIRNKMRNVLPLNFLLLAMKFLFFNISELYS